VPEVGIRWTVGDVAPLGFDALRLSVWGAHRLFGPEARYAICVNSLSVDAARERTGSLPAGVEWVAAGSLPPVLAEALDDAMAEGVAWKLAPPRLFTDRYELALDNDCILWGMPPQLRQWLGEKRPRCVIAADVKPAHGAFAHLTRDEPRNTGIRGFPPGYDVVKALAAVLGEHPVKLSSELDEQGLQVVALDRPREAIVVTTDEVTICSPFWPHQPSLGRSGAHFVGLNSRSLAFDYYGRPASDCVRDNWQQHLPRLRRLVGVPQ
jgi:hypothetical protein